MKRQWILIGTLVAGLALALVVAGACQNRVAGAKSAGTLPARASTAPSGFVIPAMIPETAVESWTRPDGTTWLYVTCVGSDGTVYLVATLSDQFNTQTK
jgi:hypothetical protein